MAHIQKLPAEIIARIAAGQVIERPVYAIKELVENSLDAGANSIDIYVRDAGLTEITVIDNGVGMDADDLKLSIEPHATSKIQSNEDLLHIDSLGFRGEALASLASISSLTISSRTHSSTKGNTIVVENGRIRHQTTEGMPIGTRVTALKLMKEVPARKKFLKTERTEFKLIYDYIATVSLAYPLVRFSLFKDNVLYELFDTDLESRLFTIFGETISLKMMHVSDRDSLISIDMYLSHPEHALPHSKKLLQYINSRPVQNELISLAIKESFSNLLDVHSFPQGVVFLTIPHQFVDVNVHPTKNDVRFESPNIVFDQLKRLTQELLSKHNLIFGSQGVGATNRSLARELRSEIKNLDVYKIKEKYITEDLIVVDNTYLVIAHEEGLLLFDQHAAHEALLYEAYKNAFEKHKNETVKLSEPVLLELTKSLQMSAEEHMEVLATMGFEMEAFGGNTWRVYAIPKLVDEGKIEQHITEILDYLSSTKYPSIDHINNKMLAFLACKSAIKAGERLTKEEARKLIDHMNEHTVVYTCPHGRPVKRVLNSRELAKMFKRA